ncbi:MAG: LacI family transcriptional regulator [Clostridia bacterium]|jgi:DNA-binding LacI/PurR family transcriptional regulator|uniref:LacI family DNA-binding transcriptional regulator n=1 Tax=Petroclostridium xylanilyticum TaxID=1792311 RepID=UPI000B98E69D|nr:LacI family DNA-binding transcriptional regulator [Petroclostridium xylanilyticum]MBZ4647362.1 LacI family transcriptional regulator [Clostridia bacterium]
MAVTIKDVAKMAGVSTSTVSRVLNNSPLISPETVIRVKKAMQELNYFPNSMARSFANQSTYTIALIVDIDNSKAFANPFFYQVQYGIEKVLCKRGYYLMIANEKTMIDREAALSKFVFEKRVDGIILPASLLKKSFVKKMEEQKFPFVVLGEPNFHFDVNWVDIDNQMAGKVAANHLIDNGYRKIAFIAGSFEDKFNRHRLDGYKKALEEHNMELNEELISEGGCTKEDGYRLMKNLIETKDFLDAVIFTNNIAAFGALTAIKEKGYKIPEEFGLVSFDNYPVAEFSDPKMTTVDIDVVDLGMQAATMLLKEIETPSTSKQHSLLSVELVSRGTSKKLRLRGNS